MSRLKLNTKYWPLNTTQETKTILNETFQVPTGAWFMHVIFSPILKIGSVRREPTASLHMLLSAI